LTLSEFSGILIGSDGSIDILGLEELMKCLAPIILMLVAFTPTVRAQESSSPTLLQNPHHNLNRVQKRVPPLRCGPLFGRGGVAFGETFYCEANATQWFAIGALAGRSGVNGYEQQGATADANDFSTGLVFVGRFPKEIRRFRFGGFLQAMYTGSYIRATYRDTYPDGNGGLVSVQGVYRRNDDDPIVTTGLNLEYRIPHGPSVLVRIGKNFGDSLAATTAGGFYFAAGPLVDPVEFAKVSGRSLRKLFH
jgi:hypothetical protein